MPEPRLCYWHPDYVPDVPPSVHTDAADMRPALNLSKLQGEPRRAAWRAMQADATHLAELLSTEGARELIAHFGGQVVIPEDDLPDSVLAAAGRKRRTK